MFSSYVQKSSKYSEISLWGGLIQGTSCYKEYVFTAIIPHSLYYLVLVMREAKRPLWDFNVEGTWPKKYNCNYSFLSDNLFITQSEFWLLWLKSICATVITSLGTIIIVYYQYNVNMSSISQVTSVYTGSQLWIIEKVLDNGMQSWQKTVVPPTRTPWSI